MMIGICTDCKSHTLCSYINACFLKKYNKKEFRDPEDMKINKAILSDSSLVAMQQGELSEISELSHQIVSKEVFLRESDNIQLKYDIGIGYMGFPGIMKGNFEENVSSIYWRLVEDQKEYAEGWKTYTVYIDDAAEENIGYAFLVKGTRNILHSFSINIEAQTGYILNSFFGKVKELFNNERYIVLVDRRDLQREIWFHGNGFEMINNDPDILIFESPDSK